MVAEENFVLYVETETEKASDTGGERKRMQESTVIQKFFFSNEMYPTVNNLREICIIETETETEKETMIKHCSLAKEKYKRVYNIKKIYIM